MASIQPRRYASGNIGWRVSFRIDGKQAQETFDTPGAAEEFKRSVERLNGAEARRLRDIRSGKTKTVPTVAEFARTYIDRGSGMLAGITQGTRDDYGKMIDRVIEPFLGDYPIDEVGTEVVNQWVTWLGERPSPRRKGQKLAAKTIQNYHAFLSSVFTAAVQRGVIESNPAFKTPLPEGVARAAVFLSRDEFGAIYDEIPGRYKPLALFLAGSGARWGEATALQWGDVRPQVTPPTVHIQRAWKRGENGNRVLGPTKTKMGNRVISIPKDILEAAGAPGAPGSFVYPAPLSGQQIRYPHFRREVWAPAVARAGGPQAAIHDLRHSHASWLIADGVPLPYVQARLGHEDIQTTISVYGHLDPKAQTSMADSIGKTLKGIF